MKAVEVQALMRGRAQSEEPSVQHTCNMGVGCEEAGVCYAEAHGEPSRCGRAVSIDIAAARRKQAEAYELQAASHRATAEAHRLEGRLEHVGFYESSAVTYDGFANDYRAMATAEEAS